MDKIIEDTGCHSELALCWALNAKNSLQNVAGFSPFQLVLGTNPRLPSNLSDDIPALTQKNTSQLIRENLNAIHAARTAFIACENDEKIRRALGANIRGSGEIKYVTGDKVLYKRDAAIQWHGPATVIGQVDQQVFVKHGSFYIRVHPCRLQLVKEATRTVTELPCGESSGIQTSSNKRITVTDVLPSVPIIDEQNAQNLTTLPAAPILPNASSVPDLQDTPDEVTPTNASNNQDIHDQTSPHDVSELSSANNESTPSTSENQVDTSSLQASNTNNQDQDAAATPSVSIKVSNSYLNTIRPGIHVQCCCCCCCITGAEFTPLRSGACSWRAILLLLGIWLGSPACCNLQRRALVVFRGFRGIL